MRCVMAGELMPNPSGKTGLEAVFEDLSELADAWEKEADAAAANEGMFAAASKEISFRRCAKELRAYLHGYQAGGGLKA